MDDLRKQSAQLLQEIQSARQRLSIDELTEQYQALKSESETAGFWQDHDHAQETMKQIARLDDRIKPWDVLLKNARELPELLALNDESMRRELEQQISEIAERFEGLKQQLKFAGRYDAYDAILSIYAGAGGTDAQDWALMLERMYLRYSENSHWHTQIIDESAGDEAGIKSVTLEIGGAFAYGKLKSEHGVHRLVRLSPFNADNLRQTSFAKVEVLPKIDRPGEFVIDEKELKIDVYRSGGHGGQSVNTTDSAVRVTHLPTGISVAIQNERSQLQNKEVALTILRSRLAQLELEQHQEQLSDLKGPNQSAEWGNQIRSYVLHPYKQVKDLRSRYETSDPDAVLNGQLDELIDAYLEFSLA